MNDRHFPTRMESVLWQSYLSRPGGPLLFGTRLAWKRNRINIMSACCVLILGELNRRCQGRLALPSEMRGDQIGETRAVRLSSVFDGGRPKVQHHTRPPLPETGVHTTGATHASFESAFNGGSLNGRWRQASSGPTSQMTAN